MVKSAFKNALTRVITRILYIIIFAFIVIFISSFFNIGIINVNAKEIDSDLIPSHTPIQIYLDNENEYDTLFNKNGLITNIPLDDVVPDESYYNVSYYIFSTYTLTYCEEYENSNCSISASPSPGYRFRDFSEDIILPKSDYQDRVGWVSDILFYFDSDDVTLKPNTHYTFFYLLEKTDSSIIFNKNVTLDLDSINFYDSTISSNRVYTDLKDSLFNLVFNYHVTYQDLGSQYIYSYLTLEFDTPNNFSNKGLGSILFRVNHPDYFVSLPFNYLIKYNNEKDRVLHQHSYLIENGYVEYFGTDCDTSLGVCHGGGYGHPIDGISSDDVKVLNTIPACNDNVKNLSDVVCHIKRLFQIVFSFFSRFGNFFDDLFNDSVNFDLDTNSDMTPVSNLLTMPLTLINAFLNGVEGSCSTYIFGSLYNHDLSLPCINIENYLGSTLFDIIDALCSIFMIFNVGSLIVTFFDRTTSLDDMFGLLYHVRDYQIKQADDVANGVVR